MHEENARGPHKLSTVETWEADTLKKKHNSGDDQHFRLAPNSEWVILQL